jgi:hypothetical protein
MPLLVYCSHGELPSFALTGSDVYFRPFAYFLETSLPTLVTCWLYVTSRPCRKVIWPTVPRTSTMRKHAGVWRTDMCIFPCCLFFRIQCDRDERRLQKQLANACGSRAHLVIATPAETTTLLFDDNCSIPDTYYGNGICVHLNRAGQIRSMRCTPLKQQDDCLPMPG